MFPGLAMACSLKDYLQGSRGYLSDLTRPNEPASHFPFRAGPTATGRLHRLIYSLFRIAQAIPICNSQSFLRLASLQLFENNNDLALTQGQRLWESAAFLWKAEEEAELAGLAELSGVSGVSWTRMSAVISPFTQ